ncbi:unnamed protein product [Rotaria sordida]|uniref:Uncharacterized protein n=1 Tax=Rotaria sordida TaxID=392033 RepID=A0A813Q8K4_9BILA|nr:unnamed protein product [Rotaria sordida]
MAMMNSNASKTLASIVTQNTTNNNTLSILTSLTSNELHASYSDLLKDLIVHIKDAMEVKQEKVHRMKKQDYICFHSNSYI